MKARNLTLVFSAIWMLFTTACTSPQKLVETGNYDPAIELAVRKLAGKRKKKQDHVQALEEAFAKANARDLREAERLKRQGRPENWERIYAVYVRIRDRQRQVAPLLPLADRYGIRADIRLVEVDAYLEEARRRSAEYLYARAKQWLQAAQEGDRMAAREAYDALRRTERYYRSAYRDREMLLQRARDLGTTHIAVALHNETPTLLPAGFEREMLGFNLRELDSRWQQYHLQPEPGLEYDYRLDIRLIHIEVSPSLVREREFEQAREIEDGFDYVLDENGNVMKDSLGNDIKVPRKKTIRARVLETYQHKAGQVHARIEVADARTRRLIGSRPVTAEAIFENRSGVFHGDERALDKEARRLIRQRALPFPTDADLLFDAAVHLRPELKRTIDRLGREVG